MSDFELSPSWFGADKTAALYTQFQVMRYRSGANLPISTFWTDKPLTRINPKLVYFFSPALRRFKKWMVEGSFVVWLDFDDVDNVPDFHLLPSLVVRSGTGFHVYWKMKEFVLIDTLALYLERLVTFYDADVMARDVTRFMRWAGSWNTKYNSPVKVEVVLQNDEVYDVRQVMALPDKKQVS
jgi:hypothetical protein